jgi:hypothetical protein
VHQYVGIKEGQKRVNAYQGGIIWHVFRRPNGDPLENRLSY